MYDYSQEFKPPAPYFGILVSASALSPQVTVPALMDTGSDASAVPLELAGSLGLQLLGTGAVQGVTEGQTIRQIFEAFLSIDQRAPQKFEVVGWHEDFALLGRDILNNYRITLDWPNFTFTIAR